MSQLPGASIGGDKGLVSTIMMELAADANRQEDRSSPEKSSGEKSTSESVANHGDAAVGKTGDVEENKLRQADTIFAGINSQRSDDLAKKSGDDDPSVDVIAALFALRSSNKKSSTATADTTQPGVGNAESNVDRLTKSNHILGGKSDVDTSNNYVPPVEKPIVGHTEIIGDNNMQMSGSHGTGEKSEIKKSNSNNSIIQQMQTKLCKPQATTARNETEGLKPKSKLRCFRKRKIMQLDEEKWQGDHETTRKDGDQKHPPLGTREDEDGDEGGNKPPHAYTTSCNVKTDGMEGIDNRGDKKHHSRETTNVKVKGVETGGLPKVTCQSSHIADVASLISSHDSAVLSVAGDGIDADTNLSGRKSSSQCDSLPVKKEVDNTSQNDLKQQCNEHPQSLVMATDESLVTPFIYFAMQQVKPCVYNRSVPDKRPQKFDNGWRGFECLHCAGQPKPRQFFYRSTKVFQGKKCCASC